MSQPAEEPVVFAVGGQHLVGVLASPCGAAHATALLVVVGGPQVRMGSHRQFVQLTRHLAAQGHAALRFDVRGMGDSEGQAAGFEHQDEDIAAAIDTLMRLRPEVRRVVLWGLCDGASASLLYVQRTRDTRVGGLVLLNPWVRSAQTLARTTLRHYYARRLLQAGFWRKALSGSVGLNAAKDWWQNWRMARRAQNTQTDQMAMSFVSRMAEGWRSFQGPILLVLSGDDVTAREFADLAQGDPDWRGTLSAPRVQRVDLAGVDHTFSTSGAATRVAQLTQVWLQAMTAPEQNGDGHTG